MCELRFYLDQTKLVIILTVNDQQDEQDQDVLLLFLPTLNEVTML